MANQNESTMQWKLDIADLKANIQQAQRSIKVANSEFKATTATMTSWSKETTGLEAKLKQLDTTLTAQKIVLSTLEDEYNLTVKQMGATSKEAQDLEVKMNNQKATVAKTEQSIKGYNDKLDTLKAKNKEAETALGQLNTEIKKQQSELKDLKDEYQHVALEQGKESESAKELEQEIAKLSDELQSNKTKLKESAYASKDLEEGFKQVGDETTKLDGGFTVLKGALANLAAEGIKMVVSGLKDLITESDSASSSFQAMTGATAESMKQYNKEMQEIYKGNYGESLDDIARAMAEVKNQTNEIDPSKLKDMTQNALALRDTFDFDVKESMRSVNMLMQQFGISSDEAFNLLVQGAQAGLDKNGDLLDTINEYGVHYKQLGFTSEEFFNSLVNGAKTGTFSVDKLGDAVKEFGIRTKDTTTTTTEGFQLIGLDADLMRDKFAKGGESAQQATQQTLQALFGLDNQVKQNQAGVDLFGTMWEDLGIEGVKALMNVAGSADRSKKSMQELDKVKYDNIQSQFAQIGRTIKTDLFVPMAQQALPKIKEFANSLKNSSEAKEFMNSIGQLGGVVFDLGASILPLALNVLKGFVKTITLGTNDVKVMIPIISALATAYGIYNTQVLASAVANGTATASTILQKGAVLAYNTVMGLLNGQITAQIALEKALALVKAATPWGLLALAVGGVVTAMVALSGSESEETKKAKEQAEQAKENVKAMNDRVEATKKAREEGVAEIDYLSRLKNELATLTDENGKVKAGYEGRAKYIMNELNEAFSLEMTMTNGVISGYKEQMSTLDQLMEKKRAKIIIDASEADYSEAVKKQTKAIKDQQDAYDKYVKKKAELSKLEGEINEGGINQMDTQNLEKKRLMEEDLARLKGTYNDKKAVAEGYTTTIAEQEYLQKLYASGNASDIALINDYVAKTYDDKGKRVQMSTQETLESEQLNNDILKRLYKQTGDEMYLDQIEASDKRLKKLQQDLLNEQSTVTNGMIPNQEAWTNYTQAGLNGIYAKQPDFNAVGGLLVKELAGGVDSKQIEGVGAVNRVGDAMVLTINGKDYMFDEAGKYLGSTTSIGVSQGMDNNKPYVISSTMRLRNGSLETYKNGQWGKAGSDAVWNIAKGTEINGYATDQNMRILANGAIQQWTGKDWWGTGRAVTDGTRLGIDSGSGMIVSSFGATAWSALSTFKSVFGIHSPSRVMKGLGLNITSTLAKSVDDNAYKDEMAMEDMAGGMLDKLKGLKAGIGNVLAGASGSLNASVNATVGGNKKAIGGSNIIQSATPVINFNQTNTSPKSLNSLEVYRKTNNLLFGAKVGLKNV